MTSTSTSDFYDASDIGVYIVCLPCEPNGALVRYRMDIDMRWNARITSISGNCENPGAPQYQFTQGNQWTTFQTMPGNLSGLGGQGVTYGGLPGSCNVLNLLGACGSPPEIDSLVCNGLNYDGFSLSCTQMRCFRFECTTPGGAAIVECLCNDAIDSFGQINNGGMFEVTSTLAETSAVTVEFV